MTCEGIEFRTAGIGDSAAAARLHRATVRACLPYLPELHSPAEDRAFFSDHLFARCTVWLAEHRDDGAMVGYIAFRPGWVEHLFVAPSHQAQGIGGALLDRAKAANDRLELWVFQRNRAAIRFYETRGFRHVRSTDGSGNEEREPDALYAWTRGPAAA